jgi:hypothetical protein
MFEKLYTLVKNNAGTAVMSNPLIDEKDREAVINEASSSIIEVLKNQVDGGKLKDLVKYFQFTGVFNNPLISTTVKKFANKLNKYYGIEPAAAMAISKELITPVMQEIIAESKDSQNKEFGLATLVSKLGGFRAEMLLTQISVA